MPGHAAMPHLARDPMLAAGHLLVALQSIVSRDVDPLETAVVSICMVEGGVAANQIPQAVLVARHVPDIQARGPRSGRRRDLSV